MNRHGALLGSAVIVVLGGVSCGGGGETTGADPAPTITIDRPEDGAEVPPDFTVAFSSSVELGTIDSRAHHVHVFVDGDEDDYEIVESDSYEITGLAAGAHTVTASLRTPDHSAAGAEDEISVSVSGGGSGNDGGGGGDEGGGGYDY